LGAPQLTRSEIGATAADSKRRTFGRGSTAGVAPGWCPSLRLKESGVSVSARAGSGQLRWRSGAANRPGLGLPAIVQNEQTVYDIMYDINIYDINVGTVLTPYRWRFAVGFWLFSGQCWFWYRSQ
jgi:hypothetical protein